MGGPFPFLGIGDRRGNLSLLYRAPNETTVFYKMFILKPGPWACFILLDLDPLVMIAPIFAWQLSVLQAVIISTN